MLWIVAALWTRIRLWMVSSSADRWEAEYIRRSTEAQKLAVQKPAKTLTPYDAALATLRVSNAISAADQAWKKWGNRQQRAERLRRRLHVTTKPRTLAGAFNGAVAVPGIAVLANALGADVTGWLATASGVVRSVVEKL